MSVGAGEALAAPQALGKGIRERDAVALEALLAPGVALNSPITSSVRFEGRARVLSLLLAVSNAIAELEETDYLPVPHGAGGRCASEVGSVASRWRESTSSRSTGSVSCQR